MAYGTPKPENVVLHQANFYMSQHATMRPQRPENVTLLSNILWPVAALVRSNMLNMPKSTSGFKHNDQRQWRSDGGAGVQVAPGGAC